MIRPAIQARRKLLFLYLLRSSSAIASDPHVAKSNCLSKPTPSLTGHIELRLATRTDVPSIQRCNLATLPENYSSNFYVNHLRQWPDLALVAEHVVPGGGKRNPFESYDASKPQNEIVGYVLGKVEEASVTITMSPSRVENEVQNNDNSGSYFTPTTTTTTTTQKRTEMMGHVTSLAILPKFRRRGIAAQLMNQLHFHMQEGHDADGVGLHVRVSNVAARKLYCEGMGYGVVEVIRGYYQDEDAFFMRKNFLNDNVMEDSQEILQEQEMDDNQRGVTRRERTLSRFSLSRMRKSRRSNAGQSNPVWENAPEEFCLPKIIPLDDAREAANANAVGVSTSGGDTMDDSSGEEAHVMTGSL